MFARLLTLLGQSGRFMNNLIEFLSNLILNLSKYGEIYICIYPIGGRGKIDISYMR